MKIAEKHKDINKTQAIAAELSETPELSIQLQEKSDVRMNLKENLNFLEVVSSQDKEETSKGSMEDDLKQLQKK